MREILIQLREGKSQAKVAESLGITQQFLSYIERGVRNPSIKLMKKFGEYYNKPINELFPDIFLSFVTANRCKKDKNRTLTK